MADKREITILLERIRVNFPGRITIDEPTINEWFRLLKYFKAGKLYLILDEYMARAPKHPPTTSDFLSKKTKEIQCHSSSREWVERHDEMMVAKGLVPCYSRDINGKFVSAGFKNKEYCTYSNSLGKWLESVEYCQYFLGDDVVNRLYREFANENRIKSDFKMTLDVVAKYKVFQASVLDLAIDKDKVREPRYLDFF